MRFMQRSNILAKWLSAILPVVIVGLVGLFAVTVIRDYGRETAAARSRRLEKGSERCALESGSRVGMGMRTISCSSRPYWKKWPGSLEYVGLRSRMSKEQS
ncbi:hypothetical protein ACLB1T_13815 [Escherichia coli]